MSTQMSEEDWEHTLLVFRACLPRRGRKAADDRKFLEAMHFFTVENVRWRALPKEYGNWNTVWKRFEQLGKAGVFEAFFDALAAMSPSAHWIQTLDSTIVRAHVSAVGGKVERQPMIRGIIGPATRQSGQALGRSRGGFTTKIHAKADCCEKPDRL